MFLLHHDQGFLALLVYVDDIIIAGPNLELTSTVKTFLHSQFKIKDDLGNLKFFLGLEIARSHSGIVLDQRKYVLDIIKDCGLTAAKVSKVPMEQNHTLLAANGPNFSNTSQYRRLVGRLIYLTVTRPDLCYSVHILSQFPVQPKQVHMGAALKLVRYLKGSPGKGLFLSSSSSLQLRTYTDADWGACRLTRRFLTGYCVMLGSSLLSWKCKRQTSLEVFSRG